MEFLPLLEIETHSWTTKGLSIEVLLVLMSQAETQHLLNGLCTLKIALVLTKIAKPTGGKGC